MAPLRLSFIDFLIKTESKRDHIARSAFVHLLYLILDLDIVSRVQQLISAIHIIRSSERNAVHLS